MEKKQFERIGDIKYGGKNKALERETIKALLKNVKFSNVLDVGARDGTVSKIMKTINPSARFLLIDPDGEALKEAKGFETRAIKLEELEGKEKFDLILMVSLLEHLENPAAALEKANKLLQKDGKLFLLVPCLNCPFRKQVAWLYRQLRYGTAGRKEIEGEHKQLFSSREVLSLLKSSGFNASYLGWHSLLETIKEEPSLVERMLVNSIFVVAEKK